MEDHGRCRVYLPEAAFRMTRYSHVTRGIRQANRAIALSRPELRQPGDGFARKAAASPVSAPVKETDPETRRLIDEALAKRAARA